VGLFLFPGHHTGRIITITLEYPIRKIQENQERTKLNGTHQILVSADNVNIMHTFFKGRSSIRGY
jgi:hypothetical protein